MGLAMITSASIGRLVPAMTTTFLRLTDNSTAVLNGEPLVNW